MVLTAQQTAILGVARKQLGKPYLYGGKGPTDFDCSGLTAFAFEHGAGIDIGAGTAGQLLKGTLIAENVAFGSVVARLQPCDIPFPSPTHCQLWTGTDIIEAASPGTLVREVPEWAVPPYQSTVYQVRRYLPTAIPSKPPVSPPVPSKWPGRYLRLMAPPAPLMTGEDVTTWQRALIAAGHPCGPSGADSFFGPATNAATIAWAAAVGIPNSTEPWIVGPYDWERMFG